MTRPAVHAAAEQVYRLLPDYLRLADPGTDYTLLAFTAAAAAGSTKAADFLTIADPGTSVSGTCEVVNPAAAPRPYLPWLGWLVGIDTATIPDADVRSAIADASSAQRRGSLDAIRMVTARTLTGSRLVRAFWNLSGTDPYLVTVVTLTDQTPDSVATLAAAWTEKPAGVDLELQVITGSLYSEIAADFADYAALAAAFATYDDLASYIA